MLEKPKLEDENIIECVRDNYGVVVTSLEFLPIGKDSKAGVYKALSNGQTYFLKVKADTVDDMSVRLPRFLKEQGIEQVVAPLPTVTQALWGTLDGFTVLLYPFIEGRSGMNAGLSDSQWIKFGEILKQIHTTRLSPELQDRIAKETFAPQPLWGGITKQLQESIASQDYESPSEKELAAFWKDKHDEIGRLLDRTEQLGKKLRDKSLPCVVCHADIHTNNLLLDAQGSLFVVDWDQPVLAPKERDLLFVTVGGFVTDERLEQLFFQGYNGSDGTPEYDWLAMAYFRYARSVEDIGAFTEEVYFLDGSEDTKQDAVKWLKSLFEPWSIVEAAYRMDRELPE